MNHSTRLADLLQSTFALHRAPVTCLVALVIALFKTKTVNLAQLATAFPGQAEIDSHYRRLQRFFQHVQLQPARLAKFVLAFLPDAPYTLTLDRTQWMLGSMPINFLVLSVVHEGIAFPLFWQLVAKKVTPIPRSALNYWSNSLRWLAATRSTTWSLTENLFDGIRQAVFNATDKWEQFEEQVLSLLWKVLTSPKALLQPLCPA